MCSPLRFLNLAAFLLNLLCTFGISYMGEFGVGHTNVEISAQYPTILTPPWFAFPVAWVLIFTFEAFFVLWQMCQSERNPYVRHGISWWFVIACLAQAAWNFTFAKEHMITSLILLVIVTKALHIAMWRLTVVSDKPGTPGTGCCGAMWLWVPFGAHAAWTGWLFAINLMEVLTQLGLSAPVQLAAALGLLAWLWAVNAAMVVLSRNFWYGLTSCWAFFCIAHDQAYAASLLGPDVAAALRLLALGMAAAMGLATLLGATCLRALYKFLVELLIGDPMEGLPSYYMRSGENSYVNPTGGVAATSGGRTGANYFAVAN
mmetsp:Transcript_9605/g.16932  ORF Transcript_9605/g.16932 Transcript_9605/m.16932 type:complete len:317 (+) Transcript_9605:111-1061(+)